MPDGRARGAAHGRADDRACRGVARGPADDAAYDASGAGADQAAFARPVHVRATGEQG
jgi:hypothetical protein